MVLVALLKIGLILFLIVTSIIGLVVYFKRNNLIGKGWKIKEPFFRQIIEDETGHKIRESLFLDASTTGDFSEDGFKIWLAFTADHMALIVKDTVLEPDGDLFEIHRKDEVALRRRWLRMFYMDLKPAEGESEPRTIHVGIPKKKMEMIRHHIRRIEDKKR